MEALPLLLHLDPEPDRVADPEAAEVGADAGLHGADGLRVGVARGHAEVAPDVRELLLRDPEQVDPLAAGDLDHPDVVLVGYLGDPAELIRGDDATVDARDDRERAVVLDVRVDAVVDEACVALLPMPVRGHLRDEVGERRLAGAAVATGAAGCRDLADGVEPALANHRG